MFLPKEDHHNWNGGKTIDKDGYMMINMPSYHRLRTNGYVLEHIYVAETITGIKLKPKNKIHHIDGNRLNNSPNNLVICEDDCYHQLIHLRHEALKATGNPNLLWCSGCREYLEKDMFSNESNRKARGKNGYCRKCTSLNNKLSHERNPETRLKYVENNKSKIKENMKQYHINRIKNESEDERAIRLNKARIATAKYRLKKKGMETNGTKTNNYTVCK